MPDFDWLIVEGGGDEGWINFTGLNTDWLNIRRLVAPLGDVSAWTFDPATALRVEIISKVRSFDLFEPFGTSYRIVPPLESFPPLKALRSH